MAKNLFKKKPAFVNETTKDLKKPTIDPPVKNAPLPDDIDDQITKAWEEGETRKATDLLERKRKAVKADIDSEKSPK